MKQYLDHGFVELIDIMGSDESIEGAARTSYDRGTRTVNDTRNLLRYLMRHDHTSPFEMAEVVFRIKLPIFVMRQLVRHRTASINELSLRYSEAPEEMYVPDAEHICGQSNVNKQCSTPEPIEHAENAREVIDLCNREEREAYNALLGLGVSREMARVVLPVTQFTTVVYKQDLKNFLHMVRLRNHPHAQFEIRELAQRMYDLVKETGRFTHTLEAFEDYIQNGVRLSAQEIDAIIKSTTSCSLLENCSNMSKREIEEFKTKLRIDTSL